MASRSSADRPPTRRQIEARTHRRLREADTLEAAMVASLLDELAALQTEIRQTVSDQAGAPFTTALAAVDTRIGVRTRAMLAIATEAITAAAAQGVAIIDDLVDMGRLGLRLPAASTGEVTARIAGYAGVLIPRATDLARLATVSQLALLAGGRQDLAATLDAIGTAPRGSKVFGRAAERLAGATTALTGEAYGAAQQIRADEVAQALSTTGPIREATGTRRRPVLLKRWISSHKTDARDTHADTEARYGHGGSIGPIPYSDDFRVGVYTTPYPRGPGLPGAQKVHCGCRTAPVLGIEHTAEQLDSFIDQPVPTAPVPAPSAAGAGGNPPPSVPRTAAAPDPDDPDDMAFLDAMLEWSEGSTHLDVRDAAIRLAGGAQLGDSTAERAARTLLNAIIDRAAATKTTLWHGEPIPGDLDDILERLPIGRILTVPIVSFTRSRPVATFFSSGRILWELEPGALALDVSHSSLFVGEQEVLSSGRFEITGIDRNQSTVLAVIRIRQVT